jgi:arsenite methyltransferase
MSIPAYLTRTYDWRSAPLTDAYDELPLWSALPGQLLLENLPFERQKTVLDIGCGTGFPLLLLARRFGPSVQVYGVDPWEAAMARARQKMIAWGLENVILLQQDARQIALPDRSIDLITSNLGLNNFEEAAAVLTECKRLLSTGGKLCLTTNLRGTFAEFYATFQAVGNATLSAKIIAHEHHRHDLSSLQQFLQHHDFEIIRTVEQSYTMTYADGTAFLHDYFIGMGFLPSWLALVPDEVRAEVFLQVEATLNAIALETGKLTMRVPIAYLEVCAPSLAHPGR